MADLESMNASGYGSDATLASLVSCIGIKPRPTKKADMIAELYKFYTSPGCAASLYAQLNDFEKDLLVCVVQGKYRPLIEDLLAVAVKYNIKVIKNSYGSWLNNFVSKNSKLNAFFVNNNVPQVLRPFLEKTIPAYQRKFESCEVDNFDELAQIINRDERYKDFDMLLSFININSVTATKAGGYISKSSLLKFYKLVEYDELCNNDCGDILDIRNAGEAIVSMGLIQLLRCADVIDIVKDKFVLSKKANTFMALQMIEKAKFLFDAYIKHGNSIIDECMRISAAKLRFHKTKYNLSGPRQELLTYLKECPINEWINFDIFSKEIFKANRDIFDVVGGALIRDDYHNQYYQTAHWSYFENCAISVMLMEYLAVLGIVDVLAEEVSYSDYDSYYAYEVSYFRITNLGAFILGLADSYDGKQSQTESEDAEGFIIQSNFDVVIQQSKDRMRHEFFFDRFASQISKDSAATIYKLDFKSAVKGVNIGISIREIADYCNTFSSEPVPENVKTSLSEWEMQSNRIRIRTVSVIETDDEYLLEEIKRYSGMDKFLDKKEIASVLVIADGVDKKVKTLIEKNKRFCKLGNFT